MSGAIVHITTVSGMIIKTSNMTIARGFYEEGATVEYPDGKSVFGESKDVELNPKPVYTFWLNQSEKDQLIAHWEKTGMFSTIIERIRSTESLKGLR